MEAHKIPVRCSVENCHYNKDNLCRARSIEISAMGDGRADTSDGTCCDTFINRT